MSNSRSVFQRPDGTWVNKNDSASRAGSLHGTQAGAQAAARVNLRNVGGGELSTHGVNGQIRAKDTVAPGPDPRNTPG